MAEAMVLENPNKMSLTGIFPFKRLIEKINGKKQERKYNKIREKIIENTFNMTMEEILEKKEFADTVSNLSEADKLRYLETNAKAAKNAKKNNAKSILLGVLGVGFLAAGLAIPAAGATAVAAKIVGWTASALSLYTGARNIKTAIKGGKGLNSDALLKGNDFKDYFDPIWEQYILVNDEMEKYKEDIMEKQQTLSKKDFQEYLNQLTAHIMEKVEQKKAEQAQISSANSSRQQDQTTQPQSQTKIKTTTEIKQRDPLFVLDSDELSQN